MQMSRTVLYGMPRFMYCISNTIHILGVPYKTVRYFYKMTSIEKLEVGI